MPSTGARVSVVSTGSQSTLHPTLTLGLHFQALGTGGVIIHPGGGSLQHQEVVGSPVHVPALGHQHAFTGVHVSQVQGEQLLEAHVLDRLTHVPVRLLQSFVALLTAHLQSAYGEGHNTTADTVKDVCSTP